MPPQGKETAPWESPANGQPPWGEDHPQQVPVQGLPEREISAVHPGMLQRAGQFMGQGLEYMTGGKPAAQIGADALKYLNMVGTGALMLVPSGPAGMPLWTLGPLGLAGRGAVEEQIPGATKAAIKARTAQQIPLSKLGSKGPISAEPGATAPLMGPTSATGDVIVAPAPRTPAAAGGEGTYFSLPKSKMVAPTVRGEAGAAEVQGARTGKPVVFYTEESGSGPRSPEQHARLMREAADAPPTVSGGAPVMERRAAAGVSPTGVERRVAADVGKWQPPPQLGAFSAEDVGAAARGAKPGVSRWRIKGPEGEVIRGEEEIPPVAKRAAVGGSGESAASQEAINKMAADKVKGITYVIEDRAGKRIPAIGPRPEDNALNPGSKLIQIHPDGSEIQMK